MAPHFIAEMPGADGAEAAPLVEAVRAVVAGERIGQNGGDLWIVETAGEGGVIISVAPAEIGGFADPDIDRTQLGRDVAPNIGSLRERDR